MSEHAAICGSCHEDWPCLHVRQQGARVWKEREIREACHRCGKGVGGMVIEVRRGGILGEDVRYHGRKGACRTAGLRHLQEAIAAADDPVLRLEMERESERFEVDLRRRETEREGNRLRKGGGRIVRSETSPDRYVTWVRLDLVDTEQRVVFAAARKFAYEQSGGAS